MNLPIIESYPPVEGPTIKVRVLPDKVGEYEYQRRRGGDVFTLKPRMIAEIDPETHKPIIGEDKQPKMKLITAEQQFSYKWMEKIEEDAPDTATGAQAALDQVQAEINATRRPQARRKGE